MGKDRAIIIGINQYKNLRDLEYANQDAKLMQDFFLNKLKCERVDFFIDREPISLPKNYTDLPSPPTFTELRQFFLENYEEPGMKKGYNLWFFFSGHGQPYKNNDYLIPGDGNPHDIEYTAIPLNFIVERLRRSGADNIILIIDACRNEGCKDKNGLGFGQLPPQGVITFFSCSPQESSYEIEQLQQGAFTYVLLNGLRHLGEDNCATVKQLGEYLGQHVPRINREYHKPPQKPQTHPDPPTKQDLNLCPQYATADLKIKLLSEGDIDYTQLRQLLANGQWEEADRETTDLIFKASGREEKRTLRKQDIIEFPCTDLQTIDKLWSHYSGGIFGFTAQKQVWVNSNKNHSKFVKLVGWNREKYSNLIFNITAPLGHLPLEWWYSLNEFDFSLLALRLRKCNVDKPYPSSTY